MLYQTLLRPLLFRLSADDPERAHEWAMRLLVAAGRLPSATLAHVIGATVDNPRLRQHLFDLTFPNPIGVAAGFDKNAVALPALAALGFGFVEAGTVTWLPQRGNPRPRLIRLPEQRALINRMGFNNDGATRVARRLTCAGPLPVPLGISLGKSRATPLDRAVEDYLASFRLLAPHAGYIAVNVSSPNTPGLRTLQEGAQIDALLGALQDEAATLASRSGRRPPLLVKLSPDLSDESLREVLDVCLVRGIDGVLAVNTTLVRPNPSAGGLSGRPLLPRALEVVRLIHAHTQGRLSIIGIGGVFNAADAYAMIRAGASLVQVYTALIYEGPMIARQINRGLLRLLERDRVHSLADLRGSDARLGRQTALNTRY